MTTQVTYELERWSLDELYPGLDSPEVKQAYEELEGLVAAFEQLRPELVDSIETDAFFGLLERYEAMMRIAMRLVYYGELKFAEDTQDQKAQTFVASARERMAELDNRTMFFKLWWKALEDEPAERLLEASGDYHYWLEALRLEKPYTLSEAEEKVVNIKNVNGPLALVTLYDTITNRYVFKLEIDGEVREMTRGELSVFVRSPDPALRAAAYQELYRVFEQDLPILGQLYQYRARDWRSEYVGMRGHSSPIAVRNLANDVSDEVVNTLLETCRANTSLFHRFFRLKATWLGVDRLRRYDIYAPVVKTEKEYSFAQAVEMVLTSMNHFDGRVAELAQRVLDERHLDGEVRKGKRSGAFCATVEPALTPYVLQSYQGRPDDVATLAHELGHAIHSLLASHHTALTQQASLPLAETASTFSEMLLIDHLLELDPDPEVQRDLLFRQMDDAYATIMRQAYFAIFEREAHDRIQAGASLEELNDIYFANLQEQFGDSLDLSEDFQIEWSVVPHFYHFPFYVYAYAFGQLLVLSLYEQYRQEGDAFKPRYIDILAAGGSASPEQVLKKAGIEIASSAFWQGGFDVIGRALEELEALELPTEPA